LGNQGLLLIILSRLYYSSSLFALGEGMRIPAPLAPEMGEGWSDPGAMLGKAAGRKKLTTNPGNTTENSDSSRGKEGSLPRIIVI